MINTAKNRKSASSFREGSVLLVTLLCVSLLLVVVLTLVATVRMELRTVAEHHDLMQARANARLGLHIALAELQAAAGPDQRSVARAGLMVKHDGVSGPGTAFPEVINALDSRSFWTGVSHSDGSSNIGSTNKPVI